MSIVLALTATGLLWRLGLGIAILGTVSSTIFLFLVLAAALRYRKSSSRFQRAVSAIPSRSLPPVTILKPVHGMEPRLADNLESFFRQDYPDFEIIFGARAADNAALEVVEQLRQRHPEVKTQVIFSGQPTWPNAKVFSLDKMIASASNLYFVISDSDILVAPDFLRNVIPPLLDRHVGLVTCPYRGVPASGFWSSLEALGMSVEMPSGVLVANWMEGMRFAMGAVMATRRDVLQKIGGIAATADYYSDDFVLGNEVWEQSYEVVLSHHIVSHVLVPRSFLQSFRDQLRWMKSTRYSRPKGHVGTALTYAMPYGLLGLVSATALGNPRLGFALIASAVLNRIVQCVAVGWGVIGDPRALWLSWLYPLRDLLGFCTWGGSFTSRSFLWRGETYQFGEGGKIIPQHRPAAPAAAK